jgi:hypothetical protein
MNESRLDEDLKALSKRPRPNLPTDFDATVWSKVWGGERRRLALDGRTGVRCYFPLSGRRSRQQRVSPLDFWRVGVGAESRQVSESD